MNSIKGGLLFVGLILMMMPFVLGASTFFDNPDDFFIMDEYIAPTPIIPPVGGGGGGAVALECLNDSDCELGEFCFENKCYIYECDSDADCNDTKTCWMNMCVKLFDMKIVEVQSPISSGEFFDFTYYIKGVAAIHGDVVIRFWLVKDGKIVTDGFDTIYMGDFEEKTQTSKLFLPKLIDDGIYNFYAEVSYDSYYARAGRMIEVGKVDVGEELLDVSFVLDENLIRESNELLALVRFESFGTIPAEVDLTFTVIDDMGREVYRRIDQIVVLTEEFLMWDYEDLNIPSGGYIAKLNILYGENIAHEFIQDFTVGKKVSITGGIINKIGEGMKLNILSILMVLGILIIALIIYWERKKIKAALIKEEKWLSRHEVSIAVACFFIVFIGTLSYLDKFNLISLTQFRSLYLQLYYGQFFILKGYYFILLLFIVMIVFIVLFIKKIKRMIRKIISQFKKSLSWKVKKKREVRKVKKEIKKKKKFNETFLNVFKNIRKRKLRKEPPVEGEHMQEFEQPKKSLFSFLKLKQKTFSEKLVLERIEEEKKRKRLKELEEKEIWKLEKKRVNELNLERIKQRKNKEKLLRIDRRKINFQKFKKDFLAFFKETKQERDEKRKAELARVEQGKVRELKLKKINQKKIEARLLRKKLKKLKLEKFKKYFLNKFKEFKKRRHDDRLLKSKRIRQEKIEKRLKLNERIKEKKRVALARLEQEKIRKLKLKKINQEKVEARLLRKKLRRLKLEKFKKYFLNKFKEFKEKRRKIQSLKLKKVKQKEQKEMLFRNKKIREKREKKKFLKLKKSEEKRRERELFKMKKFQTDVSRKKLLKLGKIKEEVEKLERKENLKNPKNNILRRAKIKRLKLKLFNKKEELKYGFEESKRHLFGFLKNIVKGNSEPSKENGFASAKELAARGHEKLKKDSFSFFEKNITKGPSFSKEKRLSLKDESEKIPFYFFRRIKRRRQERRLMTDRLNKLKYQHEKYDLDI